MRKLDYKITDVSHIPAIFRPVPQSRTSSTLLPHMTKTVSRYATLSATFIIKQALIICVFPKLYSVFCLRLAIYQIYL